MSVPLEHLGIPKITFNNNGFPVEIEGLPSYRLQKHVCYVKTKTKVLPVLAPSFKIIGLPLENLMLSKFMFQAPGFKNSGCLEEHEGFPSPKLQKHVFSKGKWRCSKLQVYKNINFPIENEDFPSSTLQKQWISFRRWRLSKVQAANTLHFLQKIHVFQAPGFKNIGFLGKKGCFLARLIIRIWQRRDVPNCRPCHLHVSKIILKWAKNGKAYNSELEFELCLIISLASRLIISWGLWLGTHRKFPVAQSPMWCLVKLADVSMTSKLELFSF